MTAVTRLSSPVVRETRVLVRDAGRLRPLIVALEPAGLVLRQKGCRYRLLLPYEVAWRTAALLRAEQRRRDRRLN